LDRLGVHAAYEDGEFEQVTGMIQEFTSKSKVYSHADSIFIAKHLAVVYSANPDTREKGKYYMYKMLELMPSAHLIDMYVSEEIDRIFEKIRMEFEIRQKSLGRSAVKEVKGESSTQPLQPESKPSKSYKKTIYWVAGGVGVAALVTGFLLLSRDEEPKPALTL
jgi:hypothetical protein